MKSEELVEIINVDVTLNKNFFIVGNMLRGTMKDKDVHKLLNIDRLINNLTGFLGSNRKEIMKRLVSFLVNLSYRNSDSLIFVFTRDEVFDGGLFYKTVEELHIQKKFFTFSENDVFKSHLKIKEQLVLGNGTFVLKFPSRSSLEVLKVSGVITKLALLYSQEKSFKQKMLFFFLADEFLRKESFVARIINKLVSPDRKTNLGIIYYSDSICNLPEVFLDRTENLFVNYFSNNKKRELDALCKSFPLFNYPYREFLEAEEVYDFYYFFSKELPFIVPLTLPTLADIKETIDIL